MVLSCLRAENEIQIQLWSWKFVLMFVMLSDGRRWRRTDFYPRNSANNMNWIYRRSRLGQVCSDSKVLDRHSILYRSWEAWRETWWILVYHHVEGLWVMTPCNLLGVYQRSTAIYGCYLYQILQAGSTPWILVCTYQTTRSPKAKILTMGSQDCKNLKFKQNK